LTYRQARSWDHGTDTLWNQLDPILWDLTRNRWAILQKQRAAQNGAISVQFTKWKKPLRRSGLLCALEK
jgi:hypothetical protein